MSPGDDASATSGEPVAVGDLVALEAGPVAHGGHVVARVPDGPAAGQVVFVRHALPGERVTVRLTDVGSRFLRGDAVEVHEASPHRVQAPCPLAHPDGCGGCDFQHVTLPEQRRLKAAVVREQLHRLAGIDLDVEVEAVPVPGRDDDGLRWRTRMQYVGTPDGRRGLRKHRSHEVVAVDDCPIAAPDALEQTTVVEEGRQGPSRNPVTERVETRHGTREFSVAADGFWQVHPEAPRVLVETVLDQLRPRQGEHVLDLYAGVGLFSAFLAAAVGESGSMLAVEGDRTAVHHGKRNLADLPQATVLAAHVDHWRGFDRLRRERGGVDLVVLDPPRTGARRTVVDAVADLRPRAVAYVACDPAALARDLATFAKRGYRLAGLRAFDLFPMTHHVECVALLTKNSPDLL
ncbi:MAG TPA: TRAM domain-containing protein [Nocardioidaceae bacterium]|nr:TRAM domain-containing protein [Nocardioidaceae bacterium]